MHTHTIVLGAVVGDSGVLLNSKSVGAQRPLLVPLDVNATTIGISCVAGNDCRASNRHITILGGVHRAAVHRCGDSSLGEIGQRALPCYVARNDSVASNSQRRVAACFAGHPNCSAVFHRVVAGNHRRSVDHDIDGCIGVLVVGADRGTMALGAHTGDEAAAHMERAALVQVHRVNVARHALVAEQVTAFDIQNGCTVVHHNEIALFRCPDGADVAHIHRMFDLVFVGAADNLLVFIGARHVIGERISFKRRLLANPFLAEFAQNAIA